jgi:copper chaperone CopZ
METKTFKVPNIGCEGCVSKIKSELGQLNGVMSVDGNSSTKVVTVEWHEPTSWPLIESRLIDIDYSPEDV